MASADPALPSAKPIPTAAKHASASPALPRELLVMVGLHADTKTLSMLSRTCHAFHALLSHTLQTRFEAEVAGIIAWAAVSCRPVFLDRAMTIALNPDAPVAAGYKDWGWLYYALGEQLLKLLYMPVGHDMIETIKVYISHNIRPNDANSIDRVKSYRTDSTSGRRHPGPCTVVLRPLWLHHRPLGRLLADHAVRRGDLVLARWLVNEARVWVGVLPGVQGSQTILDVARDRALEDPRGENVEEMIQLLIDRGPQEIPFWDPVI
ncbi:hypothetical protein DFP73DRAFT_561498 [Morchella snyderi]|nr:hypothetical protein DFP73DRAFT_561498 [Morchella snyderi]